MSEGSFSAQIDSFCEGATVEIEAHCRGVALTLFGMIIEATPVLHGRLRGDWRTSTGSPLLESRPETGSAPTGEPDEARKAELLRLATKELNDVVASWGGKEPIFLTNNMPYASDVEWEGHSSVKAPQGMVRVSVDTVAANSKKGGT